jgi:hypothetical protein
MLNNATGDITFVDIYQFLYNLANRKPYNFGFPMLKHAIIIRVLSEYKYFYM